jgi:hypothetical protein
MSSFVFLICLTSICFAMPFNKSSFFSLSFDSIRNNIMKSVMEDASSTNSPEISQRDIFNQMLNNGPIAVKDRQFLIQGWRWHTLSVQRDLHRFSNKVAAKGVTKKQIHECFDFVFNFNWKSLIRVETEIFFPWLNSILPSNSKYLIGRVLKEHERINHLTNELQNLCKDDGITTTLSSISPLIRELQECSENIRTIQVGR